VYKGEQHVLQSRRSGDQDIGLVDTMLGVEF
jgi:hypothetical protein